MLRIVLVSCLVLSTVALLPAAEGWKQPPEAVVKILDAPPTPMLAINRARSLALLCDYPPMSSLDALARPMLRLAGFRIDPVAEMPFSNSYCTGLELLDLHTGLRRKLALPPVAGGHPGFPEWSPDGRWITCLVESPRGTHLWVADTKQFTFRRLLKTPVTGVAGNVLHWMRDGRLLLRLVPEERGAAPGSSALPEGPNVQESSGKASKVRTYQDLLETVHDAELFHHHALGQLHIVDPATGKGRTFGEPGLYRDIEFSPDGRYVKLYRVLRPYPFTVPLSSFARRFEVWTMDGERVFAFDEQPVADEVPIMGVRLGPRAMHWSPHDSARLLWFEALDGGDPEAEAPHRDRLMALAAPFEGKGREILRLEHRFTGMDHLWTPKQAFLSEYDWRQRWVRTYLFDLEGPAKKRLVWDRSVNDVYGDPGAAHHRTNGNGESLVWVDGGKIWLSGQGASPDGDRPFLDRMDLTTLKTERIWRCARGVYESFKVFPLWDSSKLLTLYESPRVPQNLVEIDPKRPWKRRFLTKNEDPAPILRRVRKRRLNYERADGVPLSGILYLPPDYGEGQRRPAVVWAYPRSYSGKKTAGQVRGSSFRFTRVSGPSKLFFLLQGYVVLDEATMPVVGDPKTMNDSFVEQITANAEAAIRALDATGCVDPKRVGVGGHSYGAFMTANLLAHTDLFAAGIARSGAYNRTLTPFGFQGERRTFWEAPEIYVKLSPFTHASKVNEPLLLIHGERDPNSGTFPLQSRRFFHALKGHGATARLLLLPLEGHGYRARASILHVLAESFDWFDCHVKGKKDEAPQSPGKAR